VVNNKTVFGLVSSVAAIAILSGTGCGQTTSGVEGITCESDSDCNSGLKCLPYEVFADGGDGGGGDAGCVADGNECLMPCTTNADCASVGAGVVCLTSCGGTSACEAASDLGLGGDGGEDGEAGETGAGPDASSDAVPEGADVVEASSNSSAEASVDVSAEASVDVSAEGSVDATVE
jgi:hypothetical protein